MRQRGTRWCGGESGWTAWQPRWGLERKSLEVAAWRLELEMRLVGAMLHGPRVGWMRAQEAGVSDELFERDDARLMYQAVRCCAENGMLDDKSQVLAMARVALRWGGFWIAQAHPDERGYGWSEQNLVDLACCGEDDAGDVREYASQLIELDNAVREARTLWRRMYELLDGVGYVEALDGTCRATRTRMKVEG